MSLSAPFLTIDNFRLAFHRIVRGQNLDYKENYRHLLWTYSLALEQNIKDLINDLKTRAYRPAPPTIIFSPKPSGVLRPLKLLCLRDLIVYQAIVNIVAVRFATIQDKYKFKRSFGAIFAGKQSNFLFHSWKRSYRQFSSHVEKAFRAKNVYVADFDLVSFFDLIDHQRLRSCIEPKVRDSDLLDLLFDCLAIWTVEADVTLGHGVPQGPEASAFLAECLLFIFDSITFRNVVYARYVDDIRLMARGETAVRRALVKLDLQSKQLGLVPQAQKISLRKVTTLKEIRKSLPSAIVSLVSKQPTHRRTQRSLLKMFRESLSRSGGRIIINDLTAFKYALLRLNPRLTVLRRIGPLLSTRPDCSWVLSRYVMKFPKTDRAAAVLLEALKKDPTYDQSAAHYIEAMDACEPITAYAPYRRVIKTVNQRSEERSIRLPIASNIFLGRRYGANSALKRIEKQSNPKVRTILLDRLFGDHPSAPFSVSECLTFLQKEACGNDEDAARFSAALLLKNWPWTRAGVSLPTTGVHRSVRLLLVGLGLRKRGPHQTTALDAFFYDQQKILVKLSWRKALKKDWREVERRCIELQKLFVGNPSARLLMLDTFNEILAQNFSLNHPSVCGQYRTAAGTYRHPDWGNWLGQPSLSKILPNAGAWFKAVHNKRLENELTHAKVKKGYRGGRPTKAITFREMERIMLPAGPSWAEMIREWKKIL